MAISFWGLSRPMVSPCFAGGNDETKPGKIKYPFPKAIFDIPPFTLVAPWYKKERECDRAMMSSRSVRPKILGPEMILMKGCISLEDQVDILNTCQKWREAFYFPKGETVTARACFGRNWDPVTKYEERYRSDGSEPPPIPHQLISLAETALHDAQAHVSGLPSMRPDICIASFYRSIHGLPRLHQDCDESSDSIGRGLPVVSICIGDSIQIVYGHTEDKLKGVLVDSGDVFIYGGKSRLIYHAPRRVINCTTPSPLITEAACRPGCLYLTLKQF